MWTAGGLHRREKGGPAGCTKRQCGGLRKRARRAAEKGRPLDCLFRSPVWCAARQSPLMCNPLARPIVQPAVTNKRKWVRIRLAWRNSNKRISLSFKQRRSCNLRVVAYGLRLLCQWFLVRLSSCRLVFVLFTFFQAYVLPLQVGVRFRVKFRFRIYLLASGYGYACGSWNFKT